MLLQPSVTSPLWADHILLDISCGVSGRLHDTGISRFIILLFNFCNQLANPDFSTTYLVYS